MKIFTIALSALVVAAGGVVVAQPGAAEAAVGQNPQAAVVSQHRPQAPVVPQGLAGRVVEVKFDNGAASTLTFSKDGKRVTYLDLSSGEAPTVPVSVVKNAKGLFLVTWYEPATGYTVSHLQNYNTGTLSSTWTYLDPATGQYVVEPHQGTLKLRR
ncbi:MoaF-related domain-containing protein [Psychromicrobium sp. YIM B11713]|uniref:MoaF-related domain-containing protein n=1 Tax=Psychromicrobium sp. YIM B11713 TaxID=3145233 RepID=UPI00374E7C1C